MLHRISLVAIGASLMACSSAANGAGLLTAQGRFGGELEIKRQDVRVTINNGISVTEVEQVFLNKENRIVEALYTFPVPKNASVSNFSMWIGGKEMIGEVVEKKRARQIYESYKQTKRDPGLLEQVDFKRFEMRIFPIAAGAEQRVKLTYYQELDFDHDWANYVYPLATNVNGQATESRSGDFSFRVDVKSEVPIAAMSSPSHGEQVNITEYNSNLFRASYETADASLLDDLVIAYQVKRPLTGLDLIANKANGEDGYFQLTLTVGEELEETNPGMDYVFVLDVSGSMARDGKLKTSTSSISSFIEQVSDQDRVEVILFNDRPEPLFGQLVAASELDSSSVATSLAEVRAVGGTMLAAAIDVSFRYLDNDRPLNVIVLSDGMTETKNSRELISSIESRPSGVRVFAIGVGNEVNRPLLQQMATSAGGLAAFLSQGDDFERQARAFRRKLLRPAIENVKIDIGGDNTYGKNIEAVGDLFHGAPTRIYGRYKRGGQTNVTVSGTIMGSPFEKTASLDLPRKTDSNPELERMWAWHQVQNLKRQITRQGENSEIVSRLVSLCENYSIVSEYASFIVLENDAEYQRWNIARKNLRREARDRTAREAVNRALDKMRNDSLANLGPSGNSEKEIASATNRQLAGSAPKTANRPSNGFNIDFPSSGRRLSSPNRGGGGALDPVSATIALIIGGLGWSASRANRKK